MHAVTGGPGPLLGLNGHCPKDFISSPNNCVSIHLRRSLAQLWGSCPDWHTRCQYALSGLVLLQVLGGRITSLTAPAGALPQRSGSIKLFWDQGRWWCTACCISVRRENRLSPRSVPGYVLLDKRAEAPSPTGEAHPWGGSPRLTLFLCSTTSWAGRDHSITICT